MQVSCGPATRPGAGSFRIVRPFMTSSQSVPDARQKAALVGPAVTDTVLSPSSIVTPDGATAEPVPDEGSTEPCAARAKFQPVPSATWSRATAQPFGTSGASAFVANAKVTKISAPGFVAARASARPGTVKRQRLSGSTAGVSNAPDFVTEPSSTSSHDAA